MNIHEFQAKQLFRDFQIPVPDSIVADSAASAISAAQKLAGSSWAIKAQVHAGGRGKVGGVKIANSAAEAGTLTEQMLGQRLVTKQTGAQGLPINSVLVEKPIPSNVNFI